MKKIIAIVAMFSVLLCNNGIITNAAPSAESSEGWYAYEGYFTKDAYGESCYVLFQFEYTDYTVIRTDFRYSNNGKSWSINVVDSQAGDTLYSTATLTNSGNSFGAKAWCTIYGDCGHVY